MLDDAARRTSREQLAAVAKKRVSVLRESCAHFESKICQDLQLNTINFV